MTEAERQFRNAEDNHARWLEYLDTEGPNLDAKQLKAVKSNIKHWENLVYEWSETMLREADAAAESEAATREEEGKEEVIDPDATLPPAPGTEAPKTPEQEVRDLIQRPDGLTDEEYYMSIRQRFMQDMQDAFERGEPVQGMVEMLEELDSAYAARQDELNRERLETSIASAAASSIQPAAGTGSDMSGSSASASASEGSSAGIFSAWAATGFAAVSTLAQSVLGVGSLGRSVGNAPVPGVKGAALNVSVAQGGQSGSAAAPWATITPSKVMTQAELVKSETAAAATSGVSSRASSAAGDMPQPAAATANTGRAAQISRSEAYLSQYQATLRQQFDDPGLAATFSALSPVKSGGEASDDSSYFSSLSSASPGLTPFQDVALSARARQQHFGSVTKLGVLTAAGAQATPHARNMLTSELGVSSAITGALVETPDSDVVANEGRPTSLASHVLSGLRASANVTANTSALDALVGAAVASGTPPATARRTVLEAIERARQRISIHLRHASISLEKPKPDDEARVLEIMLGVAEGLGDPENGTAVKSAAALGTIVELATAVANTARGGHVDDPNAVLGRQVSRRLSMGGTPTAPSRSGVAMESAQMSRNLIVDSKRTRRRTVMFSPSKEEERQKQQRSAAPAAATPVRAGLFADGAKPLAMGLNTAKKAAKKKP